MDEFEGADSVGGDIEGKGDFRGRRKYDFERGAALFKGVEEVISKPELFAELNQVSDGLLDLLMEIAQDRDLGMDEETVKYLSSGFLVLMIKKHSDEQWLQNIKGIFSGMESDNLKDVGDSARNFLDVLEEAGAGVGVRIEQKQRAELSKSLAEFLIEKNK